MFLRLRAFALSFYYHRSSFLLKSTQYATAGDITIVFIRKLELTNFKRFTQLIIDLSTAQPSPKLVLLIGANGSGKTAIFDAFERFNSACKPGGGNYGEQHYFTKDSTQPGSLSLWLSDDTQLRLTEYQPPAAFNRPTLFYGRSAFRQVPQLTRTGQGANTDYLDDADRPKLYIERDQRFENDIDALTARILEEVFTGTDFDAQKLREQYITPLNQALARVFGGESATTLELRTLIPARNGKIADIRFRKGASEIHYNLLSSGEKEVLNILLNLFVRRPYYQDSIYFIDELDVHLNTSLQYALLKEIAEQWIPAGCQLWTASHSLGFIQYANEAEDAVILDFDQFDFDHPRTVVPQIKDSFEVFEIAVPKETLPLLFRDRQLTLCEHKDDRIYNLLQLDRRLFLPAADKNALYLAVKNNPNYFGLMDRDYLTEAEIKAIRKRLPQLYVLGYYSIESYLYHPQNIKAASSQFGSEFAIDQYQAYLNAQKIQLHDDILIGLQQARGSYRILKAENIEDKAAAKIIAQALHSNHFDDYYPYLDMKNKVDKSYLAKLNLSSKRLAGTAWFRNAIQGCLVG